MATRVLHVLLRVALLVAIVATTALAIDYTREAPAFCGGHSGCAEVRASAFSHVLGVGLPTIGLGVFIGLFLVAVAVEKRSHLRALAAMLGLAAVVALGLIATQLWWIHAVCRWCMTVDASVAVAGVLAIALAMRGEIIEPWRARFVWLCAGAVAVAAPFSWAGAPLQSVDLPGPIRELQTDAIDVIVFTDFECPYCRRLHLDVHGRLEAAGNKIRLTRMMVPLAFHKGSDPAARAYLCAPEGRRDAMADRLYRVAPESLTKDGVVGIAGDLGLDKEPFLRCFDDKATTSRIEADVAVYHALGLEGLPSSYIEDKLIMGANSPAFEQALGGRDLRWMIALLGGAFVMAAAATLAWRGEAKQPSRKPQSPAKVEKAEAA